MSYLPQTFRVIAATLALTTSTVSPESASAQTLPFPPSAATDTGQLRRAMPELARAVLARLQSDSGADPDTRLNTAFRLQMVAGDHATALTTLATLRQLRAARDPEFAPSEYTQYEVYARALMRTTSAHAPAFAAAVREQFLSLESATADRAAARIAGSFGVNLRSVHAELQRALDAARGTTGITLTDAVAVCRAYHVAMVYDALLPVMSPVLQEAEARRYLIDEQVRVPLRDGNILSAVVVRPRRLPGKQPAILEFTIYANEQNRATAMEAASQGYVGIVATTRGKRGSTGPVVPMEPDADDAYDLIDWISNQPWSNGSVGMMGGSYAGFTQWAAAKHLHPALKTMVPSAAIAPGIDFPRENGIVLNFQYRWALWVATDSVLDDASYRDDARWGALDSTWFARGTAYREMDAIDGVPNPAFRRWLDHPTYDAYWKSMVPSGREYSAITIPVLTTTGYFDGAQPGALHYFREHLRNNATADHTLLIGPWDHFGAQRRPSTVLGSHVIDPVARLDLIGIIYQWFDFVLRGAPKPAILSDRVNFQIMGTNTWRHVATLGAMSTDTLSLYFSRAHAGADFRLRSVPEAAGRVASLSVDFRNRTITSSTFITTVADTVLDRSNAVVFVSDPLRAATTISGAFTGELVATLNKRDVDVAVELYELTAAGEYDQLSFSLGRASLARNPGQRQLLTPGVPVHLPIDQARVISRTLPVGSRLVSVVRVNKNPESQLNYGSGKDPSDETLADGTVPLQLTLLAGSQLRIPILR